MSRPTTKKDLQEAAREQFDKLQTLIATFTSEEQEGTFDFSLVKTGNEAHWTRDQNIRDVLIHLYEWHNLVEKWITSNREGRPQDFFPQPYNWRTYGELNKVFVANHQDTTFAQANHLLNESHESMFVMIEKLSNEELFEKAYFDWAKTSTIGSYCVSCTSIHYDWAIKKLKKYRQSLTQNGG